MPHLSLSLLGPLLITLGGITLTKFATDKARALLIYLAVEAERPHRRAALAGLLWPDRPARAAQLVFNQTLSTLRQTLGDRTAPTPFLLVTPDTVQFNSESDYSLDTLTFSTVLDECLRHVHRRAELCRACTQRREQANALYRGDFLEQFGLSDADLFEQWLAQKREWLHRRACAVLRQLMMYCLRREQYEQACHYGWRNVELDPGHEETHRQLMHILLLNGNRAAALAQYEQCRRWLAAELGIAPSEQTIALYQHICEGRDTPVATGSTNQEALSGKFPAPPTPLIGREKELIALGELLADPGCHLITITGMGGVGKTHLALAVAHEWADTFAHSAAFVSLAGLASAEILASAILAGFNIRLQGQHHPQEQLLKYLQNKEQLLVLDNFEHLLAGVSLITAILQQAPQVTLLITSRERLNLRPEWCFDLEGLSYPERGIVNETEEYSAIQMFTQRARQLAVNSIQAPLDQHCVARICSLVEGMPLAIELAAAWLRFRSCAEIEQALAQSLRFLTISTHDMPARHRSLRAVFDYSWGLLSERERGLLEEAAIFRGGFGQDAGGIAGATAELLHTLCEKSLLRRNRAGRYSFHTLVWQYARERLQVSGNLLAVAQRHSAYYLALAERAAAQRHGHEQNEWLSSLDQEHDNLRLALQWSLDNAEIAMAARLGAALWWFWDLRGHFAEGRGWLTQIAARSDELATIQRARLLTGLGVLELRHDNYTQARDWLQQSLVLFRASDDRHGIAAALCYLGLLLHLQGHDPAARGLLEESVSISRVLGDSWSLANALNNLGAIAQHQGENDLAIELFEASLAAQRASVSDKQTLAYTLNALGWTAHQASDDLRANVLLSEALALRRDLGDKRGIAISLNNLGAVAQDRGDNIHAKPLFVESLALFQDLGNNWYIAHCLQQLAAVMLAETHPRRAAQLCAAAEALRETINAPLWPAARAHFERIVLTARAQLDPAIFAAAWQEGRTITLEHLVRIAL